MPPFPPCSAVAALTLLTAQAAVPSPRPGSGDGPRAVRGPVLQAAGNDRGALLVTPFGVKVVDPLGRTVRTLWPSEQRSIGRRGREPAIGWPGLTGDADYSGAAYDPDDIDDADDLRLTDGATGSAWDIDDGDGRGRAARHEASPLTRPLLRPLVAVAGATGWVVRPDGVWAVSLVTGSATLAHAAQGDRIRGLAATTAATARGIEALVAVVDGAQLLQARDAGPFEVLGGPVAQPRALAVGPAGAVLVREAAGQLRVFENAGERVTTIFATGVDDVVGCGATALVLRDGRLHQLTARADAAQAAGSFPAGPLLVRHAGLIPPGSDRIACSADGRTWATFGSRIAVSTDAGHTWTTRPAPNSTQPIVGLVPTPAALWVILPSGVWPLAPATASARPAPAKSPPALPGHVPAVDAIGGWGAGWNPPSERWRRWSTLLPQVDFDFEVGRAGTVRDVRGMVTASFRLDGAWSGLGALPSRRPRPLSSVMSTAHFASQIERLTVPDDGLGAEERRALERILEESP